VIGKEALIKGGVKLGFAGDEGLAEIKFHILAAKGYGKLILFRFGPGFGKIRALGGLGLPVLLLSLRLRQGRLRLGLRGNRAPGFRLGWGLGPGLRLGGGPGSGFLGRGKFGSGFTSGKGKQNHPYQEFQEI
jgi:hypothetical protein